MNKHERFKHDYRTAQIEATIRMVPDPNTWPRWPVLPLKTTTKEFPDNLGYMLNSTFEGSTPKPYVIKWGCIFMIQENDPVAGIYETLEDLLAAGWYVD